MVPNANHFVQHDAPELVDKTIRGWLDARGSAPTPSHLTGKYGEGMGARQDCRVVHLPPESLSGEHPRLAG